MSIAVEGPSGHDIQSAPIQIQAKSDSSSLQLRGAILEFNAPRHKISIKIQSDNVVLQKGFKVSTKTLSPFEWTAGGYASVSVGSDLHILVKENHWTKKHAKQMIVVPQADLLEMFNNIAAQENQAPTFKFETFEPQMKYIKSLTLMFGPSKELQETLQENLTHASSALVQTKSILERMGPARKFLGLVSSFSDVIGDLHPAAKAAMVVFEALYKKLEEQETTTTAAVDLVKDMLDMLPFVENVDEAVMKLRITRETVKDMFMLMENVSELAMKLTVTNGLQGLFKSETKTISAFKNQFADLKGKYDRCVSQETWKTIEEIGTTIQQDKLKPVGVSYSSEDGCLEGTRKDILMVIREWASLGNSNVFWVHGAAGSGKSTVVSATGWELSQTTTKPRGHGISKKE